MRKPYPGLLCLGLFLLAACGGPPVAQKKKEPKKPPEPVSGQSAFYRMFAMARSSWSGDVQGFRLEPIRMQEIAEKDGKFPAWRGQFVSESRRASRSYTYSVVEAEGLHINVFAGPEERWAGATGTSQPFLIQAFKIDSTAAVATAKAKGESYTRKHPDIPITPVLERTKQFPNLAWRIIWGTSPTTSNYSIYVDASTGDYLSTMH